MKTKQLTKDAALTIEPEAAFPETTRRSFVVGALGGVTATLLAACGGSSEDGGSGGASSGGTSGSGASGGASGSGASGGTAGSGGSSGSGGTGADGSTCTVYPQQTEGPFFLDLGQARDDITEGLPGTELVLVIEVVRASDCTPLTDIAVDIWHCDAGGVYSGFAGQLGGLDTTGQTFMRGSQLTGSDGKVKFFTIYPGWYPGRTTHIHFKVHPSSTTEATSQLYFPEDVTAEVYLGPAYVAHGPKDTSNAADGVNAGTVPPLLAITKTATGYAGELTISVA